MNIETDFRHGLSMRRYGEKEGLPRLYFLHGFMGAGRLFDPIAARIRHLCNPVSLDLPGHGESDGSTDPEWYRSRAQSERLMPLFHESGAQKALLYGYSMGGRLALQLAASDPDAFGGLILESTTPGLQNPDERRERQLLDEERASRIESSFAAFLDDWLAMPLFSSSPTAAGLQAGGQLREVMAAQDPARLAASLRGFGTGSMPPLWDRLSQLKLPVRLLSGGGDAKFTIIHKTMCRELPAAVHRTVPQAGHRIHTSFPEKIAREIETFIQTLNR